MLDCEREELLNKEPRKGIVGIDALRYTSGLGAGWTQVLRARWGKMRLVALKV
jgi:hypothetical protein